jgi:Fic family protein
MLPVMSETPPSPSESRNRAGRYVSQATGYRAFLPEPLPPNPPIRMEGNLQSLLSLADRALGRLDGSIQTLPNPDPFVFMYVRKEAVLSSQIEGTQSSLQDLLSAEAKMFSPELPADVDEVVNYVNAMNHGLGRLHDLPVSVRLIKEIHERLLITFLLCQREILLKPVLYLSHFFKRHRTEYYERLQAVRDHGQWEEWLAFFLIGVSEVSREATETARRILALREDHRTAVTTRLGRAAGNGLRVLESLYQRPVVTVADVQSLTGTTYTAANNLVSSLAGLGILVEATGYKRNRVFRYQPYIDLFGENLPEEPQHMA